MAERTLNEERALTPTPSSRGSYFPYAHLLTQSGLLGFDFNNTPCDRKAPRAVPSAVWLKF